MTKVGSEGDSASPLTGVQVEGGFAPTCPSMEKLGTILALEAHHSETGWQGFYPPSSQFKSVILRSVFKLLKRGRLD